MKRKLRFVLLAILVLAATYAGVTGWRRHQQAQQALHAVCAELSRAGALPLKEEEFSSASLSTPQALEALRRALPGLDERIVVCFDNGTQNRLREIMDKDGKNNPFCRQKVVFAADGGTRVIQDRSQPFSKHYEPANPVADAQGYVLYPNVSHMSETVEMLVASRQRRAVIDWLKRHDPAFPDPGPSLAEQLNIRQPEGPDLRFRLRQAKEECYLRIYHGLPAGIQRRFPPPNPPFGSPGLPVLP